MRRCLAGLLALGLTLLSGCGLSRQRESAGLLETAAGLDAPCAVAEAGGVFTMPLNEKVDFDLSTAVVASNAECLEGLCQMVLEEAAGESA